MSLRKTFSEFTGLIADATGKHCRNAFEAVAFKTSAGRYISRQFVKNHNKLQFWGYEPPNIALAVNDYNRHGVSPFGLHDEGYAAISFLFGSGAIYNFDFDKRPTRLLWGGLGLTAGGAFLTSAGYGWSGVPVAIASLETARGGLQVIKDHIEMRNEKGERADRTTMFSYHVGRIMLAPYNFVIERGVSKIPHVGDFLRERPFIAGTLIKSPPRLTYIAQKIFEGDAIGAGVGFAWLFLGDTALTFNDPRLKAYFERNLEKYDPQKPALENNLP